MKDIRVYIAKLLNNIKNKHEDHAIHRLNYYVEKYPNLSELEHKELTKKYWDYIRYHVNEEDHADIEYYCIAIAQKKEEAFLREDLYNWWFITTYYYEIIKWKIHKIFGIS